MRVHRAGNSRQRRLAAAVLAAGLVGAVWAGPVQAQTCEAPPGTAGVDQYCETVPDARGDRGLTPGGPGRARLPASLSRTEEGRRLRAFVDTNSGGSRKATKDRSSSPAAEGDGPLSAFGTALEERADSGMWWPLLAIALVLALAAWARFRRPDADADA